MSDDMLISFDSPAAGKTREKLANRNGLSSPLIPCPSTPFDLVSSRPGDDPFELEPQDPFGVKPAARLAMKTRTPERSLLVPLPLDIPVLDAATPSPLLLRRAMSDVDISGVVPGQFLVSSTPLVSNANTPTRSSHSVPRRSVLSIDGSCALVKSKLDFINKVNQSLAAGGGNPGLTRSKSISNLTEALDTSVQHKIFSSSKAVVPQEKNMITRGRHSTNVSPLMSSSKANCSSFMLEPDGFSKHETSALLSFLTSPKHTVTVCATITPEEICEEAKKMQILFSLCAADCYDSSKEEEGFEWINSSCLPDAWFDHSLDYNNIHENCDSDEEINGAKCTNRLSTQQDVEALRIRLNRFRRSSGPKEDNPVKESKEDPVVDSNQAHIIQPEAAVKLGAPPVQPPPVEAQPVVIPLVVAPKLPIVPELRPKVPNPVLAKKGPLKAVEPVPNMIKKSHSSDMLKIKPALARGRLSRPVSEQGPRRQGSPASRRSNSIPPPRSAASPSALRSAAAPPVKNPRPPVKLPGIRPKTTPSTGGKGKENRV